MQPFSLLDDFLTRASKDPRIAPAHIGLFCTLVIFWQKQGRHSPLQVFSRQIMDTCKISSSATYHKLIYDLHDGGYLRFEVSFHNKKGSRIYLPCADS